MAVRAKVFNDDKYKLTLVAGGHSGKAAGSLAISAAAKKRLGEISFSFDKNSDILQDEESKFAFDETLKPLPEIHHVFRLPEKRPPVFVSQAFALAVVIVPWLYLSVTV